jgi:hypothetical protein
MASPWAQNYTPAGLERLDYSKDLPVAKWGSGISLHGSNPEALMSALGQKQTSEQDWIMSALPPKADIAKHSWDAALCQERTLATTLCKVE